MRQLVGMVTNGQVVDMREGLTALFENAGLTEVQDAIVAVPVGAKAKEDVRELSLQSMFATASFATATLKKIQPVELKADIEPLPARLVGQLRNTGESYNLFALWAQKPESCQYIRRTCASPIIKLKVGNLKSVVTVTQCL